MKHLHFITISLFILFSGLVYSQEFPSTGEIYDYNIGDIFHVYEFGSAPGTAYGATVNIEILEKYYSNNGDTVFYVQLNKRLEEGSNNPTPTYTEIEETIYYTNLDEILITDSILEDDNLYNGRITIFHFYSNNNEIFTEERYTVGCGHSYHLYRSLDPENQVDFEVKLVYFKKGDEEWGEQIIIGIPATPNTQSLKTYPNPVSASQQTHLTFELPIYTNETPLSRHLRITNISGKTVAELPLIKGQTQLVWNCSTVASGVYFYQTEIAGVVYRGKIIVN